jgi:hypothetical protein
MSVEEVDSVFGVQGQMAAVGSKGQHCWSWGYYDASARLMHF